MRLIVDKTFGYKFLVVLDYGAFLRNFSDGEKKFGDCVAKQKQVDGHGCYFTT